MMITAYLFACFFFHAFESAPVSTYCGYAGKNLTEYAPNSTFQSNLNLLIPPLSSNNQGFKNSTAGEGKNVVYGISLCRGDVSDDVCLNCTETAGREIVQMCNRVTAAVIWYNLCMLRYSNRSIIGNALESPRIYVCNRHNYSNVLLLDTELGDLMDGLRSRATSENNFAEGTANLTSFQKIYGMVQCTPDLTEISCINCLDNLIRTAVQYCHEKKGFRIWSPSCYIRYEFYSFSLDASNEAPAPTSPGTYSNTTSPSTNTVITGNGRRKHRIRNVTIAVLTVLLILISLLSFFLWKKATQKMGSVDEITTMESVNFKFRTISAATGNFSKANMLGQGGFGPVFKGKLSDGKEIAVKRLSVDSGQGELEFMNEVLLLAKLQHRNLVKLFGFCLHGNEKILIYEFLANTSLDHFIFDPVKRLRLDWGKRYKIIRGIARGLLYLHEDSRLRIIHRDLKAGNILLDAEMKPKISDFGTARLFLTDQTHDNTNAAVGTYGYMAPEYALHGQFSLKSDVFSFGVLLLEIISGEKNTRLYKVEESVVNFLTHAWKKWNEGKIRNLMDPILRGSEREINRCIHIGLLCVQEIVANRPTMNSVFTMLNSHSLMLEVPSEPAFFMESNEESDNKDLETDTIRVRY